MLNMSGKDELSVSKFLCYLYKEILTDSTHNTEANISHNTLNHILLRTLLLSSMNAGTSDAPVMHASSGISSQLQ